MVGFLGLWLFSVLQCVLWAGGGEPTRGELSSVRRRTMPPPPAVLGASGVDVAGLLGLRVDLEMLRLSGESPPAAAGLPSGAKRLTAGDQWVAGAAPAVLTPAPSIPEVVKCDDATPFTRWRHFRSSSPPAANKYTPTVSNPNQ